MRNGFVPCCYDNAPCRGRFHRIHEGRKGLRSLSLFHTRLFPARRGRGELWDDPCPAISISSERGVSPPRVASSKRNVPPLTIESIFLRLIWLSTSATHIASTRINVARFSVAFIALPCWIILTMRKSFSFFFYADGLRRKRRKRKRNLYLYIGIDEILGWIIDVPFPLSFSSNRES